MSAVTLPSPMCCIRQKTLVPHLWCPCGGSAGGREGGQEGGRAGGREGGRKGGRAGGREEGRGGGRERGREGVVESGVFSFFCVQGLVRGLDGAAQRFIKNILDVEIWNGGNKKVVLFIGTRLVTSSPQWIRRLVRPRDLCVYTRTRSGLRGLCLYVNVCSNVLGSCGLCTFGYVSPSTLTFSSPRTVDIRSSCHFSPSRPLCRSPPAPHLEPTFFPCPLY